MSTRINNLDEYKKGVIKKSIIAFIVLLIVVFIVSLFEKDKNIQENTQNIIPEQSTEHKLRTEPQIPNSLKYDYNNNPLDNPFNSVINADNNANNQIVDGNADVSTNEEITLPSAEDITNPEVISSNTISEIEKQNNENSEIIAENKVEKVTYKPYLYCGSYSSEQSANSIKTAIAFIGVSSNVKKYNNAYSLKLGPFKSRDEAIAKFNELSKNTQIDNCSLAYE